MVWGLSTGTVSFQFYRTIASACSDDSSIELKRLQQNTPNILVKKLRWDGI